MTPSRRRKAVVAAVAVGSVAVLAAGCTRPGGGGGIPWRTTTTWTSPIRTTTTMDMNHGGGGGGGGGGSDPCNGYIARDGGGGMDDHGGGGMDHGGGGAGSDGHHVGFDHAPTASQQKCAKQLVVDTRKAAKQKGLTSVAALKAAGYISIGDGMTGTEHFVNPGYHRDSKEMSPSAIEAFAVRSGRVVAAMYVLTNGKTRKDVPDVAGNWTMWHDHVLPFRSNNPMNNGYYQLGGMYTRQTAPMLHVWLVRNNCGPFAGTDTTNMTGSCSNAGEPGTDFLY